MHSSLVAYLVCPKCAGALALDVEREIDQEIMEGALTCSTCASTFPIVRGVPRMTADMDDLQAVARSFGFEWKAHHQGALEDDTLFGRTRDQDWDYFLSALAVTEGDLDGKVMLDAGCGSARLTQQMAARPGSVVIGIDMNDAVDEAFQASRHLPNVHIVQANILSLPLAKHAFDVVWSNGVIHHTPDAAAAHHALSECVKPGGRMYVWVYAKRFNPLRFTKDVFDLLRLSRLPAPVLLQISKLISYPYLVLLRVYRGVRSIPGLRPRGAFGRQTIRPRTLKELQLSWFDALSPEFDSRHTEDEVIEWFRREGFGNIGALDEPKVGVRGTAPAAQSVV